MKVFVFCALIFCFETAFAEISIKPYYNSQETGSVIFSLKKHLVLSCLITADSSVNLTQLSIDWKKDGTTIKQLSSIDNRAQTTSIGQNYTLTVSDGQNSDVGNWSCEALLAGQVQDSAQIQVVTNIAVKIKASNINVVEEEKLRIECSVLGNPYPALSWRIETGNYNGTVYNNTDGRVKIENYQDDNSKTVENGVLIIEKVNKTDRGNYFCIAVNKFWAADHEESSSEIRVKDKYAALWPFLGICVEVVVLCAVIIIYEKKRNKTEMEESDTDQSPDQKNTPDHGKEANLRHRQ